MSARRRRLDIPMTIPQPLADVLARRDATWNIQPLLPNQEAVFLGFVETIRSIELASLDKSAVRELCDALREDGVLPGKSPP